MKRPQIAEGRDVAGGRLATWATLLLSLGACGGSEPSPVVGSVTITPSGDTIVVSQTLALTAVPRDLEGRVIDGTATWTSSDTTVAAVSDAGMVTGKSPGTVMLHVTVSGFAAQAPLTVVPGFTITLSSADDTVAKYATHRFTAVVRGLDGEIVEGLLIHWSADDRDVVRAEGDGSFRGVIAGRSTTITAAYGFASATARLTVIQPPVVAIEMTLPEQLPIRAAVQPRIALYDEAGLLLTPDAYRSSTLWATSDPATLEVDADGQVTALQPGAAEITIRIGLRSASAQTAVTILPAFTDIATGTYTSCAISVAQDAYCWGQGGSGELGNGCAFWASTADCWTSAPGSIVASDWPVLVAGGHKWRSITLGYTHACGVTIADSGYCWGSGPLGGPTAASPVPVPVTGGHRFVSLDASDFHTCGVTAGQEAFCWGENRYGQLGNVDQVFSAAPVRVQGGVAFAGPIATYPAFTCAVAVGGAPYCWGSNFHGNLGSGDELDSPLPRAVVGNLALSTISASEFVCGLALDGKVFCWGSSGQKRLVPVLVGEGFVKFSAGAFRACGIRAGLELECHTSLFGPYAPPELLPETPMQAVAADNYHACAVAVAGAIYCWGDSRYGQTAANGYAPVAAPVKIVGQP